MVSDIRDVVFQSDPFDPAPQSLELFLESGHSTFGQPGFNRDWVIRLESREFVDRHAAATPSCSGTVLGPASDLLAYLGAMRAEVSWRRIPLGNHDQGIHNALILKRRLPTATVIPNGHGRVLTMGDMLEPAISDEGLVTAPDGSIPAIVHQYDRFPQLAPRVLARYA